MVEVSVLVLFLSFLGCYFCTIYFLKITFLLFIFFFGITHAVCKNRYKRQLVGINKSSTYYIYNIHITLGITFI